MDSLIEPLQRIAVITACQGEMESLNRMHLRGSPVFHFLGAPVLKGYHFASSREIISYNAVANGALIDEFANCHSLCSTISPIWSYLTRLAWVRPSTQYFLLRVYGQEGKSLESLINHPICPVGLPLPVNLPSPHTSVLTVNTEALHSCRD